MGKVLGEVLLKSITQTLNFEGLRKRKEKSAGRTEEWRMSAATSYFGMATSIVKKITR